MASSARSRSSTPRSTPGEETRAAPSAPTGIRPGAAPRSCHRCKQRKVRCDKKSPCSPCRRAGGACEYPPPGPRTRRSKQTIMADMALRISSLEASLAGAREAVERLSPGSRPSVASTATYTPPPSLGRSPEAGRDVGRPCEGGGGSRDDVLERNVESFMTTPPASSSSSPRPLVSSPFNALGVLSSPDPSVDPSALHPTQSLAVRLWNLYVSNADCCSGLKILHIPTDELRVYATIHDPSAAPFENLALSFAVYFAATVSVAEAEVQATLGQDKDSLLRRCKAGLEQSLAHGNFLDCPTITGLQALLIYLSVLRVQNRGKGLWILNGLAVRIGQSLGLHRDGSRLGLPPFQSEIRRRLWWHLLTRDGRAGEDYGIERTNDILLTSDVQLPLNLDDGDIYPEMTRLPDPKPGWTIMTFSLVSIELAKSTHRLCTLVGSSPSAPSEESRSRIVGAARAYVEERLQGCNPAIPQHRLTLKYSRFLLRKLEFTAKIQWSLLRYADRRCRGGSAHLATETTLEEALQILDRAEDEDDGLLAQFRWMCRGYPQYHATMYVLWHLSIRPEGPNVERAWVAADAAWAELQSVDSVGHVSKMSVLTALRAKALAARDKARELEATESARQGDQGITPVSRGDRPSIGRLPEGLYTPQGAEGFSPGVGDVEWPNWTTLVQGFQLDDSDAFFSM
ncbi:uncharacterized protein DNG_08333 [Cephalotrichum gorgonifer]|uniref:Zn(2)-C6 fungal-type domain-containing protein n=1 Tax=Cephalotrichum gorgonifer TaxID=2041049 RepID=A0AAE8N3B0_9PEZI|nr:uncharacterized protein DNG_08333 [Cephalotrichum gorgonifer]